MDLQFTEDQEKFRAELRAWLDENGVASKGEIDEIEAKATAEIDAATEYAEAAPTPDPESALRHVLVEED